MWMLVHQTVVTWCKTIDSLVYTKHKPEPAQTGLHIQQPALRPTRYKNIEPAIAGTQSLSLALRLSGLNCAVRIHCRRVRGLSS